jgi:hypothetical protein
MVKYAEPTLKFSIKEADIVLSDTIGVFFGHKIFLSGKYHENHNVKSEIRISKCETNSNNQNPNELNKKSLCQGKFIVLISIGYKYQKGKCLPPRRD